MNDIEKRIIKTLEKVKPYLNQDGGDVEFVKYEDGVAFVKLKGACSGCMFATITLKNTIEEMLISEVPEIIKVENVND